MGDWRRITLVAAGCALIGLAWGSFIRASWPVLSEDPHRQDPCDFTNTVDGPRCHGRSSSLTVLVPGYLQCPVWVGGRLVGFAPMFRKPVPVGRCSLVVRCGDRTYCERMVLSSSVHRELKIEQTSWVEPNAFGENSALD